MTASTPQPAPPPVAVPRLERWSDRLNPLLVREVRQSLRSRVFAWAISLTACLSAVVLICGILAIADGQGGGGRQVFSILFFILWGLCCVVLPLAAATRFRNERGSGEFELFLITGITARQVVAGKLQAALVQVLLALSVAAPFLMVCYLLRGISAPQIALNLLCLMLFTVALTQGGIMIGAISGSKAVSSLMMLPFALALLLSFTVTGGLLSNELWGELFGSPNLLVAALSGLLFLGYYFVLFNLGAVALLEFEVHNRAFPLRLFLLVSALLLPAGMWASLDADEPLALFYVLFLPVAVIATLLAPVPGRPVPRPIREEWGRGWRRWLRPLFYPDRGSVFIWYVLLIGALSAWEMVFQEETHHLLGLLCAGLFLWSMLGNLAGRLLFPKTPTILFSILGNGVPSLCAVFVASAGKEEMAQLLCPLITPFYVAETEMAEPVMAMIAVGWMGLLAYGVVLHLRCRRQEKREAAAAGGT